MLVGQYESKNWEKNEVTGKWEPDGTTYMADEIAHRDLCPACLEEWEKSQDTH